MKHVHSSSPLHRLAPLFAEDHLLIVLATLQCSKGGADLLVHCSACNERLTSGGEHDTSLTLQQAVAYRKQGMDQAYI